MSGEFSIYLQFHHADRDKAMRLARFIADIEPECRDDVILTFVNRHDCEMVDKDTFAYVAGKMSVTYFSTISGGDGWPDGPNGMAVHVIRQVARLNYIKKRCALLIEPDCLPVARDWINQLRAEYDMAASNKRWIVGAYRDSGPPGGHINGNMIIRPDLASLVNLDVPKGYAWDCHVSSQIMQHAWRTDMIRNLFQTYNATEETMVGGPTRPVLVHGIKDSSGDQIARRLVGL